MGKRRSRDKSYYVAAAKKARKEKYHLVPDIQGFLVFCNHREKDAIREAYNVLNEYADTLYGPEVMPDTKIEEEAHDDDDDDVEKALEKEMKALEARRHLQTSERRFQVVDAGVQNVVFIRTNVPDPVHLCRTIMDDIRTTGVQKSRHLLRLVPVVKTCKAYPESLKEAAKDVLTPWFKDKEDVTFCVVFKSRLNGSLTKEAVVIVIGEMVKEINVKAKVEYKTPDLVVVVEVMKGHCCLGIVPKYFEYKKCNLVELAHVDDKSKNLVEDDATNVEVGEDDKGEDDNLVEDDSKNEEVGENDKGEDDNIVEDDSKIEEGGNSDTKDHSDEGKNGTETQELNEAPDINKD